MPATAPGWPAPGMRGGAMGGASGMASSSGSRDRPWLDAVESQGPNDAGVTKVDLRAPAVVQQVRRRRASGSRRDQDIRLVVAFVEVIDPAWRSPWWSWSSQTVHADSSSDRGLAMTAGAPGMPRSGPRFALSISAGLTTCGLAALPVTKRADAKFRTGCSVLSMRTYSAPESRDMTIAASPHPAFGRRNARIAHTATTTIARTQPAMSESDCARIGSCSIRMSPRSSACSIRRTRNRYPLTCSRVVG